MNGTGLHKRQPIAWIPHRVIARAPSLLPMLYTMREITEELGIPQSTLRGWLAHGAPCRREGKNRVWIHGQEFAAWIHRQRKPKRQERLSDDQAYCLRCNQVVQLSAIEKRPIKGKLVHFKGRCPNCGAVINRGGRLD
jgi:hypothetical protein